MTQYLGTRAAITWTPSTADGESSVQRVHLLARPLQNARPGFSQATYTNHSLDRTTIDTISVGTGAHELVGSAQMDDNPQSLLDLIVAGAQGTTLTYVPDLKDPDQSYACSLVAPLDINAAQVEADQQRAQFGDASVTLRLRQTDETRFDALYQGTPVLFHYRAGGSLADATFTRADTAHYTSPNGTLTSAASGKARVSFHDLDGDGFTETPVLLLEQARTNLVTESEDFSTWTDVSTPTQTASQTDPKGGTSAVLLGDDNGAAIEAIYTTPSFTGDAVKAISVFVRRGATPPPNGSTIQLWDQTATTNRLNLRVEWAADGSPDVTAVTGTHVGTVPYRDGWYRILGASTSVTAANTNHLYLYANDSSTAGDTGDIYIYGAQAENGVEPTSYNPATGGIETRAADVLYFPFNARAQALTIYVRFVELGTVFESAANGIVNIGTASTPRLALNAPNGGTMYQLNYNNGAAAAVTSTPSGAVSYGDVVELRGVLSTTGTVQLDQSLNGAAVVAGSVSSGVDLRTWSSPRIYLGSRGGSNNANIGIRDVLVVRGVQSWATMRRMAGV